MAVDAVPSGLWGEEWEDWLWRSENVRRPGNP